METYEKQMSDMYTKKNHCRIAFERGEIKYVQIYGYISQDGMSYNGKIFEILGIGNNIVEFNWEGHRRNAHAYITQCSFLSENDMFNLLLARKNRYESQKKISRVEGDTFIEEWYYDNYKDRIDCILPKKILDKIKYI